MQYDKEQLGEKPTNSYRSLKYTELYGLQRNDRAADVYYVDLPLNESRFPLKTIMK